MWRWRSYEVPGFRRQFIKDIDLEPTNHGGLLEDRVELLEMRVSRVIHSECALLSRHHRNREQAMRRKPTNQPTNQPGSLVDAFKHEHDEGERTKYSKSPESVETRTNSIKMKRKLVIEMYRYASFENDLSATRECNQSACGAKRWLVGEARQRTHEADDVRIGRSSSRG